MANGYSATGYGLAIRDEKDKSSLESVNVGFQFVLKLSPIFSCCEINMY